MKRKNFCIRSKGKGHSLEIVNAFLKAGYPNPSHLSGSGSAKIYYSINDREVMDCFHNNVNSIVEITLEEFLNNTEVEFSYSIF